jgi:hypothetical protein
MGNLSFWAALIIGIALGLYSGRLLTLLQMRWESAHATTKSTIVLLTFLLGGNAATTLFVSVSNTKEPWAYPYIAGLGLGLLYSFFWHRLPTGTDVTHTLKSVKSVVDYNEQLREMIPDPDHRATVIATMLTPPKVLERHQGLTEEEFTEQLEEAVDDAEPK